MKPYVVRHKFTNPPQWLLDGLLQERKKIDNRPCPDCGVAPGFTHTGNCDVARCLKTGSQRLICECGECGFDTWEALWPGIMDAYEAGLVVVELWQNGDTTLSFDLNSVALKTQK